MNNQASSTSAVVPFRFESNEIRTITIDGDPWFVAADVCAALGIDNVTNAIKRIPARHATLYRIKGVDDKEREVNIISESGMYRLVLRSDKPQAEPFIEWVTAEVLPAIRKTGRYQVGPEAVEGAAPAAGGFHTFVFEGQELVVHVAEDGAPWFRSTDIARVLGYASLNQMTLKLCDQAGKRLIACRKGNGQAGAMVFVDEANLFRLLIRSSKTGSDRLQRFFADTVLPALRASLRRRDPDRRPKQEEWLSVAATARELHVSAATVYRLLEKKRLACRRVGVDKGCTQISAASVRKFVETRGAVEDDPPLLPGSEHEATCIEQLYAKRIKESRLLWWFDATGRLWAKSVHPDAYVYPLYDIPKLLAEEKLGAKEREALPRIVEAAVKRMTDKQ